MLTVMITLAMVFSAFAILAFAAEPAYAAPATNFTLTPNSIYGSGTASTRFAVVSSSMTFPNNVPLYYEWSSTGSWSGSGTVWFTLSGTAIASGTLTPSVTASSGTYYFLVSSEASGASGVYASNAITVASTAPTITTVQSSGIVGSTVNVTGSNYAANSTVNIYFFYGPSTATSLTSANMVTTATASAKGVLAASFSVPTTEYGNYGVIAVDINGSTTEYGYHSTGAWYTSFSVLGSLTVSYSSGSSIYAGQSFGVSGTGFVAAGTVTISDNDVNASGNLKTTPATITVGSDGTFTATVSTMGATFAALSATPLATTVSATESGVSTPTATLNVTGGSITVSPGTISPGGSFTVTGVNFYPGGKIAADSITVSAHSYTATLTNSAVTVSSTGTFTVSASTLTFTGNLASNNKQTVTAPETLPSPVTMGGSTSYSATGMVNITAPQITVTYPSGYSLTASENVTVSGTNLFPGATIGANSITFAGVAGSNTAVVVPSSGSFSVLFTVPKASALSGIGLGVQHVTVTQTMPGGLSYHNTTMSVNAIYSKPTVNNTGIEVALSSSASASTSITLQNVGTTIYYYLFGYPAAQTVSLEMGSVQVVSSIMTDANGAYSGTFVIPALPGSVAGVAYLVQTQSALGLQANSPSTVSVSPVIAISGTESYFTNYGLLASGDYFNITGTGFDALATVTLSDSASITGTVASSVTTDVYGSFTAEMQVTGTSLTSNTAVDITATTTATTVTYTLTSAFTELGTPTLTLSESIGTTGDTVTATVGNAIDTSIAPVSYSVTGPMGKTLTGLTYSSDSGTISVTDSTNGTATETLAANITGFPGANAVFLLSIPGSTGYLLNSTGGNSISATLGGSFTVYAVGFGSGSYVNLGATGKLSPTGGSSSKTTDGGYIFSSVTIPTSSTVGTYLIFGQQSATSGGSATYTTSLTGSLVVSFSANLTLQYYTDPIGTMINETAYGLVADHYYNLYFGTTLLSSSPFLGSATIGSFDIPSVAAGTYNVSIVPVGSTTPAASAGFTVNVTGLFSLSVDAPTAFPGQFVTFSWPVANVFTTTGTYGPVTVTVYLNGTAFTTVPVSPNVVGSKAWLNGSFQMPNDNIGTYWTLTLSYMQTQYTAGKTASATTASGAYIQLVSGNGALLTGITSNQIATLLASINSTVKTSMKVPLSELNATVVKLNSTAAEITTAFGNMTATLKAINASVSAIVAGQVIVTTDLGTVTTSLASLNSTLASVSGNVATINTAVGTQTTTLNNINTAVTANGNSLVTISTDLGTFSGTITSVSGGLATINTQLGTMQTNVSQIAGYTGQIKNSIAPLKTGYGTLEIFLIVIIVLVLITLVLAFMAINGVNKMSRKVTEEKKQ